MSRTAKQIIILGFNGTGKTTLTRKFVDRALKSKEKVLIVTPDGTEWSDIPENYLQKPSDFGFTGAARYIWDEDIAVIGRIYKYFFDGLLIFDDCRSYLGSLIDPNLKRIFMRRRQMKADVILCGHGFTDVPVQAFTNTSDYFLFLTLDKIDRKKNVIPRCDLIEVIQKRVNTRAMDNKKGWVKEGDPKENIHYFEHVEPLKIGSEP